MIISKEFVFRNALVKNSHASVKRFNALLSNFTFLQTEVVQ